MEISSQRPQVHEQLPHDLIVEKQLSSNGSFGDVYLVRDERRRECGVAYLRARVTPRAVDETWEKPFQERLQKMYGRFWPHVSPLSDVRRLDDGRWLLCHPAPTRTLAAELQIEKGCDRVRAARLAEQLLAGLAELHSRGISHGGLCPENIWIEPQGNSKEAFTVSLGNVEIGDLAAWSENQYLENYDSHYRSADRKGIDGDLYAVGIILVELLRGRQVVTTALAKLKEQNEEIADLVKFLPSMPDLYGKAARLGELARSLLSSKEDRPQDAQRALAFLRKPSRRWVITTIAVTAAGVVALLVFIWLWSAARNEVQNLEAEVSKQAQRIREVEKERDDWKRKIENPLPQQQPLPPTTPASQRQWNDIVTQIGGTGDYVDQLLEKIQTAQAQGEAPAEFADWYKTVAEYRAKFAGWERSDPQQKLPGLLRDVAIAPWKTSDPRKTSAVDQFDARMKTLEAAARSWRDWVNAPLQTPESVKTAIGGNRPIEEQEVLNGWMSAFHDKTDWQFCLLEQHVDRGTYPSIEGDRRVTMYHNGTELPLIFDAVLPDPYTHVFDANNDTRTIEWKPGEPLQVILERGWRTLTFGARSNLAEGEFKGPFALQKLHWEGRIDGPGVALTFKIVDCPGPPQLPSPTEMVSP